MTTSQVVRALEAANLFVRGPHPHDTRAKTITVSTRGRDLAARAVHAVEATDEAFFASLHEDRAALLRALARLLPGHGG